MKFLCFLSFVFCIECVASCSAGRKQASVNELHGAALIPYGRYAINEEQELELIGSAVHVGVRFLGRELVIQARTGDANAHGYLQYELDGKYGRRLRVEGNQGQGITITADDDGAHTLWVYKATEAHSGPLFIQRVLGTGLQALKQEMPAIEFIGNSITCGAAADPSDVPCGSGVYHDQHNAYYAYGPCLARTLGVNYFLSSVSGIGIYRNWNSDGPTMPQVYEKTDLQMGSNRNWDFRTYQPRVISIALGTNDYSNGDGKKARPPFDSASYVSHYIKFVSLVKSKYPSAKIALLSSPMVNGDRRIRLQNCLSAVKENVDKSYPADNPVRTFFFAPMQARGCSGHPNLEDHEMMARELAPFFRELLKE